MNAQRTPIQRFLLLSGLAFSMWYQAPAQEAKPADPFLKPKPEAKPAPNLNPAPAPANPQDQAAPGPEAGLELMARNMNFALETYTLPQADLDAIHAAGLEAKQFYSRVRGIVAQGKGALDSFLVIPTRSGQRCTSESIDEVTYATEFDPPVAGRNYSFPTAYEMRPTGQRVELDPVLSPDELMVDINVAPDFTRLAGFTLLKSDKNSMGELQPLFATRKNTTSVSCPVGIPTLIGTSSSPTDTGIQEADGDGSASVTFCTVRFSSPAEAPRLAKPAPNDATGNLRMVFRFYSLPRATARDLIANAADADELHASTVALGPSEVKLERLITLQTRSGQRTTVEETGEYIYGTEITVSSSARVRDKKAPPPPAPAPAAAEGQANPAPAPQPMVFKNDKVVPSSFSSFELRPIGWRIEVDPVLGPDGRVVDLNLAPEHTKYRGRLQGHEMLELYPFMPIFSCQKITTAVSTNVGRQCFLGTISAPHDTGVNGREDDERTWFAFVMVTLQ